MKFFGSGVVILGIVFVGGEVVGFVVVVVIGNGIWVVYVFYWLVVDVDVVVLVVCV